MTAQRRRRRRGEHVVMVMRDVSPDEPRAHGHCTHCNERLPVDLPMNATVFSAMMGAFAKVHRDCKRKAGGAA